MKSMRSAYRSAIREIDPGGMLGCPMKALLEYKEIGMTMKGGRIHSYVSIPISVGTGGEEGEDLLGKETHATIIAATCIYDTLACGACRTIVPGRLVRGCLCGTCRRQIYCSVDCQRAHWPEHRISCFSDPASKRCLLLAEIRARGNNKAEAWENLIKRAATSFQRAVIMHAWVTNQFV